MIDHVSPERMEEEVNHPARYNQGGVECIDAIKAGTVNKTGIEAVCVGNVIKYLWRYENKNGLEDVEKARWYLDRLIQELSKDKVNWLEEDKNNTNNDLENGVEYQYLSNDQGDNYTFAYYPSGECHQVCGYCDEHCRLDDRGCNCCKHFNFSEEAEEDEECKTCKHNICANDSRYETAPENWEYDGGKQKESWRN